MQIKGNFKIVDSAMKIEREILKAFESEMKLMFTKATYKIQADVINLIIQALQQSPEIMSLRSGKLKLDFGLADDPTENIIYAIANSTQVKFTNFKFTKSSVSNAMGIYIQATDFNNLLALPDAVTVTELGTILPWLEWLLTAGDSILISDWHIIYGDHASSRSGGAHMVPKGIFKVDSTFSGTRENNFISRALNQHGQELLNIVEKNL